MSFKTRESKCPNANILAKYTQVFNIKGIKTYIGCPFVFLYVTHEM